MRATRNDVAFLIKEDFERSFTLHLDSPCFASPQEIRLPGALDFCSIYRHASNRHRTSEFTSDEAFSHTGKKTYRAQHHDAEAYLGSGSHFSVPEQFNYSVLASR